MKGINKIVCAVLLLLCAALPAFAENTPAIRLKAPAEVKAGETFAVQLEIEASPQEEISAVIASLKWNPARLEAVGSPVLKNAVLSEKLAADSSSAKGISSVAGGTLAAPLRMNKQGKFVFAEQQFKAKADCKKGETLRIGFTTDKEISGGTECIVSDKTAEFALITGAMVQVK